MTKEKNRYSDAELDEFKQLILKKLEIAKQEFEFYQSQIQKRDEYGEGADEHKYNNLDDGTAHIEAEYLTQQASRQRTFIDHLEKALVRIENKTYGICRETGKLISKARLMAVPHATLSIEAKKDQNK